MRIIEKQQVAMERQQVAIEERNAAIAALKRDRAVRKQDQLAMNIRLGKLEPYYAEATKG